MSLTDPLATFGLVDPVGSSGRFGGVGPVGAVGPVGRQAWRRGDRFLRRLAGGRS